MAVLAGCGGDGSGAGSDGGATVDGAIGPDGGGTGGTWEAVAPLAGGARQETGVAALGGRIYVVGGFDAQLAVVALVERYDPAADSWETVAPLPQPLHHANLAAAGDRLYVCGALTGLGFTPIDTVYEYDPQTDEWTEKTAMPTARGASAVGVVGTTIYVAGGSGSGGSVADFAAYDTAGDSWETLPELPEARNHLVGGAVGDVFYAIGGRSVGIEGHTTRVDAFDTAGGTWSSAAPMPTSRGGAAAAVVGARIVVAGGEGNGDDASGVFDDVEIFDATAGSWSIATPMLTPRHGTGAAAVDGAVYVPGGATVQAFGAVATVEVFRP
jgi:N-acetylneuraminic acid mutarotase